MKPTHGPTHYLKPTISTIIPQSLVFVDTETYSNPSGKLSGVFHHFRLGVATYVRRDKGEWRRRKVLRFKQPEEFWTWLDERCHARVPTWVFAHNIGFDLTILDLWDRIDRGLYDLGDWEIDSRGKAVRHQKRGRPWKGCMILADPPTIISLRGKTGLVRFVDTFNYFRQSLEKMGESIDHAKLPLPADTDGDDVWFDRCERDVEIIERTMCGLMERWEKLDCGVWQETAAGLAWAAFRRDLPKKSIVIDHRPGHTDAARSAYYGGEANVYFLGRIPKSRPRSRRASGPDTEIPPPCGPVYLVDVRSCYPSVMRDNYFPVEYHTTGRAGSIREVCDRMAHWLPISRVLISSDRNTYPYRPNAKDPTTYACGLFWTWLPGPELGPAIDRGDVADIGETHWYIPGQPFRAYVDRWYAERVNRANAGDGAGEQLCKLLLDSLSGKFGQHRIRWEDRPGMAAAQRWGEWYAHSHTFGNTTRFRGIGGLVQELVPEGEGREAFAPIAAYITSYAREKMRGLRSLCPVESVLYQDTDALLVTRPGYDALIAAGEVEMGTLGKLQTKREAASAELRAVKFYRLDAQWTIAGVKGAKKVSNLAKIEQEHWQGLHDVLRTDPRGIIEVDTVTIDLSRAGLNRPGIELGWQKPLRILQPWALPF